MAKKAKKAVKTKAKTTKKTAVKKPAAKKSIKNKTAAAPETKTPEKRKMNMADKAIVLIFIAAIAFGTYKLVDYYTGWGNAEKVILRNIEFAEKNAIYKRYDVAIEKYEMIIKRWGDDESNKELIKQVRLSLAKSYKDSQRYIKAIDAYKVLIKDYENGNRDMYAWLLLELGDCYNGIYNTAGAVKTFEKIIAEFENTDWAAEALFGIAEAYRNDGNNEKAVEYYNKIVTKYKKGFLSAEAMTNLGKIYEAQGKEKKAMNIYARVVKEYPEIVTEYARLRHEVLSERLKD